MNIFENYLKKIKDLIKKNQKKLELKNIDNLKGINLEIPPSNINSDLSSSERSGFAILLLIAFFDDLSSSTAEIKSLFF